MADLNVAYENIPEEPKKVKGFIGFFPKVKSIYEDGHFHDIVFREAHYESTKEFLNKWAIENNIVYIAIVEINVAEGDGLQ
jgi:hypothetical protein